MPTFGASQVMSLSGQTGSEAHHFNVFAVASGARTGGACRWQLLEPMAHQWLTAGFPVGRAVAGGGWLAHGRL
ncbi:hypothetical protein [Mangrovicoccus ximenensis]|uniref:hypothetical protein n=1 Tax=Mangrovicoccus ximenensis TaxID=1911570 RepID=UPI0011AE9A1F